MIKIISKKQTTVLEEKEHFIIVGEMTHKDHRHLKKLTQDYLTGVIVKPKEINKKQILKSKIIKWGLVFGNLGYFSVFLISILIAIFIGPNGYNPYFNAISDLGYSYITPFPFLFDLKAYIGSILLISIFFIVKGKLDNAHRLGYNFSRKKVIPKNLINSGVIFGIIGAVGYTFVGVFNLDRPGLNGLYHYLFAVVTFGGFIISISIFSLYILILKVNISKVYAIYGLISPFLSTLLWYVTKIVLFEWISFLSILGFLMSFQSKKFTPSKM